MPMRVVLAQLKKEFQHTNMVYLNPADMETLGVKEKEQICLDEIIVARVGADSDMKPGTLGTMSLHWMSIHLNSKDDALGKTVMIEKWSESSHHKGLQSAHTVSIVVDTYSKEQTHVPVGELENHILNIFKNEVFCNNLRWITPFKQSGKTYWLRLRIANIYIPKENADVGSPSEQKENERKARPRSRLADMKTTRFGNIDTENTVLSLLSANNPLMHLEQPQGQGLRVPNWDPESLGIGGLDDQFATIFRRAFASRLYPAELVKQLGVKHVKGMLLYGPPGTGKTLIARSIGKMLTEREPKVVNGPEILNKYVGQSEENIRALFQDAEEDQEKNGDKAGLHIIIFDEIDAICKARGSVNTGTGVHDTVVNQLLSKIDGVNSLNNVLVIGMTNRKDLIDIALLRSGRLEVHIEIGLPDEEGREQIFRIHTRQLRENGFLDEGISLADFAKRTKNYSGAEIEECVRSAVSYAMEEHIDTDNLQSLNMKKLKNIKISKEFFEMALREVQPEFGAKDSDLAFYYNRGMLPFNDEISEILALGQTIVSRMRRSHLMNRQSLLLHGDMATGKTALAAYIATHADFPFVRIISADDYVGRSDASVCSAIGQVFDDAYKSDHSVVVIDDFERLIGYTIGPRFSNSILQSLLTVIRKPPKNPDRKLFVVVTSTYDVVRTLEVDRVFDFVRQVPYVSSQLECEKIVNESGNAQWCKPNPAEVVKQFPSKAQIGIADLLTILELSQTDDNDITPESFKTALQSKFRSSRMASAAVLQEFDDM